MYAILAEDRSDVEVLKVLIGRIHTGRRRLSIKGKGYDGAGALFTKGARDLRLLVQGETTRFVICYDCDRDEAQDRHTAVLDRIVVPAQVKATVCVLVPVQEIEAWFLADLHALKKVVPSWVVPENHPLHPEKIKDPKEILTKLTRVRGRPLYTNAHNQQIAKHLNLDEVRNKCPSIAPLFNLVLHGKGNT